MPFTIQCPNDELIQKLIPNYTEMVELMVQLLTVDGRPQRLLDLGAGPGRISEVIYQWLPDAEVTLLDQSDEILHVARRRLTERTASYHVGDFTTADLGDDYDGIVAGLTLHHLEDPQKQAMAERLWQATSPGGLLVISDIIKGATPAWDAIYERLWLDHIADLPSPQLENVVDHYRKHDRPADLESNLHWLRQAGFEDVGCHWQRLNFAIFSGRKPRSERLDD